MIGAKDEKIKLFIKICTIIIAYIIIGLCGLFFILVSKVNAATYIKTYNNNGNLDICYNATNCSMTNPDLNAYEFANPITISDNSNVFIRIDYTTNYLYKNYTINEQNMYIYLHGSIQHPITSECSDSGTQTVDPGYISDTKVYRHIITCNFFIQSTDAFEFVVAMGVSKTQGVDTPRRYLGMTLNINEYQVNSTPNTSGTEASIDNASSNIINNQNSNTQSIIGNQNSNTQSIIDSSNQNAQDIIDNQNANSQSQIEAIEKQNLKCENIGEVSKYTEGYVLTSTGDLSSNSNYKVTGYYNISENSYTLTFASTPNSYTRYCLYDENKIMISCDNATQNLTINNTNAKFLRVGLQKSNNLTINGEYCYNLLEKQNEQQQQQNDYLMDDTPADYNIISGIQATPDTPISSLLTMPIRLVQAFLDNINGQCSDYTFGSLYGTTLKLKCSDIRDIPRYLGSAYEIIDYFMCFFMIYNIFMLLIHAYETITTLKDDFANIYETKVYGNGKGFDY